MCFNYVQVFVNINLFYDFEKKLYKTKINSILFLVFENKMQYSIY